MRSQEELRSILSQFIVYGDFLVAVPFGSGHINDTYQVTYDQGGIRLHYTLQRINSLVFKRPDLVMENVDRVTRHIREQIRKTNATTRKRTIVLLRTADNKPYVIDGEGNYWRCYVFIENARSYEVLENERQAFYVAQSFGQFQCDLVDLDGPRLHETIPHFHDTPKRLEALKKAFAEDKYGRAAHVRQEMDFVLSRQEMTEHLLRHNAAGEIPERITHNDTKVNNILMDDLSGEGMCVIDLDTVMPGLALYDFGDMVRAGTSPAEEDEVDLSKVFMRFSMYEALLRGYVSATGNVLTEAELYHLPLSGMVITLEVGMRFLTDYLEGDVYFKTRRPEHNLERCRNQFKLVSSMEEQLDKMKDLLKTL